MNKLKLTVVPAVILLLCANQSANGQTNKDSVVDLNNIIISANRTEELKKNVVQQSVIMNSDYISSQNAQSSADLLASDPSVFVQKSQLGGGSPVLRGFEANRVVLVVDGVRMNNIIYRGGHLQNIVTLDQASLDRVEVLFGPSSTMYGSDALGGVMSFFTKKPKFSTNGKLLTGSDGFFRFGTVNNETTVHGAAMLGGKKFASYTSLTYSSFGDLRGGTTKNPLYDTTYGDRNYYADRINGVDSMVKNSDPAVQKYSGYNQYDIVQKFLYKQNERITHGLNIQFSNSTDVPRYDRLTDMSAGKLKSAQWYYGPQTRFMAAYDMNAEKLGMFDLFHLGVNYQSVEESRHSRSFGSSNLSHRTENVNVVGANADGTKIHGKTTMHMGIDFQYNTLKSTAEKENINTGATTKLDTRYPDGDNTMMNLALYYSGTTKLSNKLILTEGIRVGYNTLHSTFVDTSFFHLPYTNADQSNLVYSANLGLIHPINNNSRLSFLISTGFRTPNVDDLSKVFESAPGSLIVPNKDLKPEKTINFDLGFASNPSHKTMFEANVFYTSFFDAIVTSEFKYNGQDSILYDGSMSRVLANQNQRSAYIAGFTGRASTVVGGNIHLFVGLNYTYGRIKTDSTSMPLDHIAPLVVKIGAGYHKTKYNVDLIVNYNGKKSIADYYLNGEDNEAYATKDGMPAWYTLNLRGAYKFNKHFTVQAGIDNILDVQYRTFASGINAPGRNIYGTLRYNF